MDGAICRYLILKNNFRNFPEIRNFGPCLGMLDLKISNIMKFQGIYYKTSREGELQGLRVREAELGTHKGMCFRV